MIKVTAFASKQPSSLAEENAHRLDKQGPAEEYSIEAK